MNKPNDLKKVAEDKYFGEQSVFDGPPVVVSDDDIKGWVREHHDAREKLDISAHIEKLIDGNDGKTIRLCWNDRLPTPDHICLNGESLDERDIIFHEISISKSSSSDSSIYIENCNIVSLTLRHKLININDSFMKFLNVRNSPHVDSLVIRNCYVADLNISEQIKNVHIDGCYIGCVNWVLPKSASCNFNICQSVIATEKGIKKRNINNSKYYGGLTALRSLLQNLENTHNSEAAHYVRGRVLRAEHPTTQGFMRVVSWFYGVSCDYGLQPWRAFVAIGVLFALVVAVGTITQGVGVNPQYLKGAELAGWQQYLQGGYGAFWSSCYLALKTLINPLSLFDARSLVVPNIPTFIAAFIQAVLNVLLVAVIILSVRRRFKIGT